MGHCDNYTVDELREIVEPDRPDTMRQQALAWTAMSELLTDGAEGLRTEANAVTECWSGRAATGYHGELGRAEAAMRDVVATAANNAQGWSEIADIAEWARDEVLKIHAAWCEAKAIPTETPDARYVPPGVAVEVGEPRDEDVLREPFDAAARSVMDSAAELILERHERYLSVPARYRPPPGSALPIGTAAGQHSAGAPIASEDEDDPFFGSEGPQVSPMLQTSGSPQLSTGGVGVTSGGTAGTGGTGPMLASAPMRPAGGTASVKFGGGWDDWGDDSGPRFSRAPKKYTGDATGHRLGRPRGTDPEPVDAEVERLSRRAPEPDDDDPWQPSEPTVPGVITREDPPEPPFHDPGTVVGGR